MKKLTAELLLLTTLFVFVAVPQIAIAATTTLDAVGDAEIDGHVNWRESPKGIPNAGWSHDATELKIQIYDPVSYPEADASHALIKWDVSGIPIADTITTAALEMSGWDYTDGPIDVYAIDQGDWDEATVSWNSWAATTKSLVLLGQLTSAGPADLTEQTTWSDPDLTAWVRQWASGSQENYGLILKMHDDGTPGGDSFSAREHTAAGFHAPQLIIGHETPAAAGTVVLDAVGDAEIDEHINWRSDTKGIPHPEWGHDASELRVRTYDHALYPDPNFSHVLIKWDVFSITATDEITDVTLEMSGWDYSDGSIDVYAIDQGDWDEATVTWDNWAATTKSLVLLGQLTSAGPAHINGQTTWSDPDLTTWVQDWVSGSQANHGLILKMHEDGSPGGDSFSSHEDTWASGHAPQLTIDHEPSTPTLTGTVVIDGYVGDLSLVGVQVEFRQAAVPVRTERVMLDAAGSFSIPDVTIGTYDIAIKAYSQLQKVITNVDVPAAPTDIGTITLQGGDINGDGLVDSNDFAVLAVEWLSAGDP